MYGFAYDEGIVTDIGYQVPNNVPSSWIESASENGSYWQSNYTYVTEFPKSQIYVYGDDILFSSPTHIFLSERNYLTNYLGLRVFINAQLERQSAADTIDAFAGLPPDWGGRETKLPPSGTREAAKALLAGLPLHIATPHISPSADGEIGFTWQGTKRRVEALLDIDGHLVWFWKEDDKILPGDEIDYDGSFPDELLSKLEGI
jgi:hypothetical protein